MKRCTRCGQEKPLDEFYRNRSKADGHDPYCAECRLWLKWRFVSLDSPIMGGQHTWHYLVADKPQRRDETYEKVVKALYHWIDTGVLKKSWAAAIYMHAVEEFSFAQIGDMAGCTAENVYYAYWHGIRKLRELYAQEAESA